jgi:hypothetical protein
MERLSKPCCRSTHKRARPKSQEKNTSVAIPQTIHHLREKAFSLRARSSVRYSGKKSIDNHFTVLLCEKCFGLYQPLLLKIARAMQATVDAL